MTNNSMSRQTHFHSSILSGRTAAILPRVDKNRRTVTWRESSGNAVLRIKRGGKAQFSPADLRRIVTLPDELVEDAVESLEVKLRLEHRFIEARYRDESARRQVRPPAAIAQHLKQFFGAAIRPQGCGGHFREQAALRRVVPQTGINPDKSAARPKRRTRELEKRCWFEQFNHRACQHHRVIFVRLPDRLTRT